METEYIDHQLNESSSPGSQRLPQDLVSNKELGAIYRPDETVFRVWAPTAGSVVLNLYEAPVGRRARRITMIKDYDGTWEAAVAGDLLGVYYTFSAAGDDPRFDPRRELLDPYARCVTSSDGRSLVAHDETPVAERESHRNRGWSHGGRWCRRNIRSYNRSRSAARFRPCPASTAMPYRKMSCTIASRQSARLQLVR
jgi:pullulanase/glycogen debranching enzyme